MTERTPQTADEWKKMAVAMQQRAHQWQTQHGALRKQYDRAVSILKHLDREAAAIAAGYVENPIVYTPVNVRDERDRLQSALDHSYKTEKALMSWITERECECECGWRPEMSAPPKPPCEVCAEVRQLLPDPWAEKAT